MSKVESMEVMEQVTELIDGVLLLEEVMGAMGRVISGRLLVVVEPVEGRTMVGEAEITGAGREDEVVKEGDQPSLVL